MGPNNSVEQEGWGLLNCDAPIDRVAVVCAALVIFANRTIEAGEELGFPRHPKILDSKKAGTDYAQVRGSTTTDTSRSGNGVLLGGCGVVVAPPLAGMSRCTTDAPKYVIRRELATRLGRAQTYRNCEWRNLMGPNNSKRGGVAESLSLRQQDYLEQTFSYTRRHPKMLNLSAAPRYAFTKSGQGDLIPSTGRRLGKKATAAIQAADTKDSYVGSSRGVRAAQSNCGTQQDCKKVYTPDAPEYNSKPVCTIANAPEW
ncbi:hypothetical protein FN846DRAFT_907345 [Sphaerosporella brunnea]|uniref:Uncharacterized protein n=1 Tax=Sphaerosporella brunnea TaxID=1250544 RepID=A0A5J5EVT2_9PEZI|nr:hypothetical protein FN846DRAFT_907345 [Sphaerosporella brunnea]